MVPGYSLVALSGIDAEVALSGFEQRKDNYIEFGALSTLIVLAFGATTFIMLVRRDSANRKLAHAAAHDARTGLLNRGALEQAAKAIMSSASTGQSVAVFFLDLDDFGSVNDAFGHAVGDSVLKQLACVLQEIFVSPHIVGRIGGDEFVAVAGPAADAEILAIELARRVRTALAGIRAIEGNHVDIRASIGVSLFHDGNSLTELIRHADAAMFVSKSARRGIAEFFDEKMEYDAAKYVNMRSQLAMALELKQIEVFYQPKVSLRTGRPVGMEALVRWRHPEKGLISPVEFVPVAERTGLIMAIGEAVLNQACRDCKALIGEGFEHLSVAVNVSALQFRQPDLIDVVGRAIAQQIAAGGAWNWS